MTWALKIHPLFEKILKDDFIPETHPSLIETRIYNDTLFYFDHYLEGYFQKWKLQKMTEQQKFGINPIEKSLPRIPAYFEIPDYRKEKRIFNPNQRIESDLIKLRKKHKNQIQQTI